MFCRVCAVTAGLLGAGLAALIIREIPGGIRELRAMRMAKWKHG
jgi:hypothetical protein